MVVIGLTKPLVFPQECAEFLHVHKMTCSALRGQYKRKLNVGQKSFPSHWEQLARQNMIRDITEGQGTQSKSGGAMADFRDAIGGGWVWAGGGGTGCAGRGLASRGYLVCKGKMQEAGMPGVFREQPARLRSCGGSELGAQVQLLGRNWQRAMLVCSTPAALAAGFHIHQALHHSCCL